MFRLTLHTILSASLFCGVAMTATQYADSPTSCGEIQMRGVSASMDRTLMAKKDPANRQLHGFLTWPQSDAPLSQALFSADWDQTAAPFGHTVFWRFPQGQEMRTIEIDFGDGRPPVFSYAKHLVTVADSGCKGIAYYEISLQAEWESRLKSADSVKMKITGLAETMPTGASADLAAGSMPSR